MKGTGAWGAHRRRSPGACACVAFRRCCQQWPGCELPGAWLRAAAPILPEPASSDYRSPSADGCSSRPSLWQLAPRPASRGLRGMGSTALRLAACSMAKARLHPHAAAALA
eukprot:scaffold182_cov350-Prasinococcus_capsulatus_cf.AAC.15